MGFREVNALNLKIFRLIRKYYLVFPTAFDSVALLRKIGLQAHFHVPLQACAWILRERGSERRERKERV